MTGAEEKYIDALTEIERWCSACPEAMFRPVSEAKIKEAGEALKAVGVDIGALHGVWARHLLVGIGDVARRALS